MQIAGQPAARSSSWSQAVSEQASRPIRSSGTSISAQRGDQRLGLARGPRLLHDPPGARRPRRSRSLPATRPVRHSASWLLLSDACGRSTRTTYQHPEWSSHPQAETPITPSVRECWIVDQGLASLRVSSLMLARWSHGGGCVDQAPRSPWRGGGCGRARRSVRSTTQRLGSRSKPWRAVGALDDLQRAAARARGARPRSRPGSRRRRRAGRARGSGGGSAQQRRQPVAVLDVWRHGRCRGSSRPSVSTSRCRLRPLIFLPASKPRGPPLSVVLTDWLSMIPAVGWASRPAASRAPAPAGRGQADQGAVLPPAAEVAADRALGGKPLGSSRHWQPVRSR